MNGQEFLTAGRETGKIPVKISYRIIELFSDGLYSSPHKAIEELVVNAFDAGAQNVHVLVSPDRAAADASITIVDDGTGMDADGLEQHWLIGVSKKRSPNRTARDRKQIGRFGIGKLATFVLARYLTHVCKCQGKYYAVTMDYKRIPSGGEGGIETERVELPLRELTAAQAKAAVAHVLAGRKPGYSAVKLFGPTAAKSWTVAIMSGLKPMATEIQLGRLSWVLRTAMPLRPDFILYLNGDSQQPAKLTENRLNRWVLGKDPTQLPKPAPADELEATEDPTADSLARYGFTHPSLGRVTGYFEAYDASLTSGKSSELGRSNGFFVYVLDRLVNLDDALFGLPALHHGTFARFRMVVHIDRLDDELRSSRESIREGALLNTARNILHGAFNHARASLDEYEASREAGSVAKDRIAGTPGSLARRPILGMLRVALDGKASPRYIGFPRNLKADERESFFLDVQKRVESDEGLVTKPPQLVELSQEQGLAILDLATGTLQINALHPFVAAFRDDFDRDRDTLALLAMAEVLTEAYLYELGLEPTQVQDAMQRRDELLRHFARSMRRTANLIARDLEDAATDQYRLELELVAAFNSMGFEAIHIGGNGPPDGTAVAHLSARDNVQRRYVVSLEAKSKQKPGARVAARTVNISAVARQRDDYKCDHAVVVAPEFPTTQGKNCALLKEAQADRDNTGKSITFVRIVDLARLVRLVPLKNVGLDALRKLFKECTAPEEAKSWIDVVAGAKVGKPPYKDILATIWELQREVPSEAVEWAAITTALRRGTKAITLKKDELIDLCKAMQRMTPQVVVREHSVELTAPPERVMEAAGKTLQDFPEDEQRLTIFKALK